jgi:elongator complex protein 1
LISNSISRVLNISKEEEDLDVPFANFQAILSSNGRSSVQTVSLRFVAESREIIAIMRGGEVIMISVDEKGAPVGLILDVNITYSTSFQFEVEGTFESGILAAAWNPDESVVAIVTGATSVLYSPSLTNSISKVNIN